MKFRTGSDHNLIWAYINLTDIQKYKHKATQQEKINRRKVFKYKEVTQENWENYSNTLNRNLVKITYREEETDDNDRMKEKLEEQINSRWDDLVKAILKAADEHLLHKLVIALREEANKTASCNPRVEDLCNLRRLARKARLNNQTTIEEID